MTKPWYSSYEEKVPQTIKPADQFLHQTLEASAKRYPQHIAVRMILFWVLQAFL